LYIIKVLWYRIAFASVLATIKEKLTTMVNGRDAFAFVALNVVGHLTSEHVVNTIYKKRDDSSDN